ncbi:MocR-like pyridoxine biosynthesis transcription factor PdxR [Streptomyces cavernicola]|uniref:PLP-dependent aminotransferase family protein n=1 Tax=Streptomyces cavernicola TaxID=3043613 RepID=A0ABT6SBT6_9ACTN|nr:PLP-dependent aminotransferase family protein [Streptomyces sp. B-S-A6]MDI3405665.1 PLP-dependent aminotransferase family protein [Streptomyces sp. B-S-A6]
MPRTLIEVDRESSEPLYRQIRKAIEHGIAVGTIDARRRLPSSRELARELGLSRNTVNAAYQELVAEGFVESRVRQGIFVNREIRAYCTAEERPATPRFDWASRLRGHPEDTLPHIEKRPDWARYPYPFLAGQVDLRAFPARDWSRALNKALYPPHIQYSLQDGIAADDPLLVEMVCRHLLPARGVEASPEEVLITVGSQQGLDLLSRALLGQGSVVAVEDPGYLDARHIFVRAGATLLPMTANEAGLKPPKSLAGVDLLHVTPSHHHPTNATLSIGRRRELLSLVRESGTVIVEDDYDSEFRYQGSPTPALKGLDETDQVVYLGTFSKFLAPGLRLGYLVGSRELVRELRDLRRYSVRHPSGHIQRALALLIESGEYHRAVRRYRGQLMHKWEAASRAVNAHLPWHTTPPPGGVSLWMSGPAELDCRRLVDLAQERGVLIERGDIYFLSEDPPLNHFRIGFAAPPLSVIDPGIRILGELVDRAMVA